MKAPARSLALALPLLAIASVLVAATVGAGPSPSASGAAPSASASAAPPLPVPSGAEIPSEPSPAPTADEWTKAKAVRPGRGSARDCALLLVREWLRVRCTERIGAGLVAGDPKGVSVRTSPNLEANPLFTTVILPLSRGESKIVTFFRLSSEGYNIAFLAPGGLLSVVWRSGRADPTLVMNDQ